MKMIDFHVHVMWPEGIRDCDRIRRRDPYFDLLCTSPKNALATIEEVIEEMDSAQVEVSVVFGYAFADIGLCRLANDYVSEGVKRFPGRVIGFGCVPPRHPSAEAEILRCKEMGLAGIGELFPDGQDFDIQDPAHVGKLAGACASMSLPVMIHVNELVGHSYPGKGSTGPDKAYRFAKDNPGLDIIYPHLGGGLFVYELMPEVGRELVNVHYDTAAVPLLYRPAVYQAIAASRAIGKVLFGSDFPLLPISRYREHIGSSGISDDERRRIFSNNPRNLLGRLVHSGWAE